MPEEIYRKLEEVPLDVKTLFRTVQNGEEKTNFEDGDYVALYNSDSLTGGRNEHRWMRIGKYDEIEDRILVQYFLNYETTSQKLGAEMNFSKLEKTFSDSKPINIPDKIYEEAKDALYRVL